MEDTAGAGVAGPVDVTQSAWVGAVLDALPDPVLLVDTTLAVTALNPAARRLLAEGAGLAQALVPADRDVVLRAVTRGGAWETSAQLRLGDGTARPFRLRGGELRPGAHLEGAVITLAPLPRADLPQEPEPRRGGLADELSEALRGGQVVLHYQPVVRLKDRRPVAAEALVRWEHPRRGLLGPTDVLAAADTPELARLLGGNVLRQACLAAAGWEQRLPGRPGVRVAVNLAEHLLLEVDIVTLVRDALTEAGCPPRRLLLEVTEEALLREPDAALRALRGLKTLGVGIVIDDLGTGSSPLSYLNQFPVDLVKIDRSLIAGLGQDPEQSAVVASLVSLAQAIGVPCVAEGVETADQLAVLRRLGCELGQGYVFSRAMSAQATSEWLERRLAPQAARSRARPGARPETIQRALELQAEGASLHTVAARLNAESHRNTGGRRWHHTSVAQLIAGHVFPDLTV